MKKLLIIISLTIFVFSKLQIQAQSCLTDEYFQKQLHNNIALKNEILNFQQGVKLAGHSHKNERGANLRIIPVVVHVIHQYGPENISKNQILDQIRILNLDFRRQNADASSTRSIFQNVAIDCEVEFRMATKDPQGNCTDGIERIYSSLTNTANEASKLNPWPKTQYLNIWIVKTIDDNIGGGGIGTVLGYAQFPYPGSGATKTDGVLIRGDYFGSIGSAKNSGNNGRVATHEIGHWLGLFHTFQGGCNGSFPAEDVYDTPPVASANSGCPSNRNSCTNDVPDLPDQTENFMDYSDGKCQNMFSSGQKDVIDGVFQQYRGTIYTTANLKATGVYDTSNIALCIPKADFYTPLVNVCQGSQIKFYDNSTRGKVANYKWYFENGNPATAIDSNPTVSFTKSGSMYVKLVVANASGADSVTKISYINVVSNVSGYKTPWQYSFETNTTLPSELTAMAVAGSNGWKLNKTTGYASTSCLYINNYNNFNVGDYCELTIPPLDMTSRLAPNLEFFISYARRTAASFDNLKIFASSDCGLNWNNIFSKSGGKLETTTTQNSTFTPASTADWRREKVSLSAYQTVQNLMLRFTFITSGVGNNFYIDNINVGGWPLATNDIDMANIIEIYPNPNNGNATIKLPENIYDNIKIILVDMTGRQLTNVQLPSNTSTFELRNIYNNTLSKGIYQLIFVTEKGSVSKSLVVE
ncbi:MAG: M43 family zinc metalloprotease [Bacteroidota bacterium]|nr:M43 family zinc metalloprotease [Bacteroidota bacterium]